MTGKTTVPNGNCGSVLAGSRLNATYDLPQTFGNMVRLFVRQAERIDDQDSVMQLRMPSIDGWLLAA